MAALDEAANARDFNAYRRAWDKRERVREQKELLSRYESIVEKLHHSCPGVVELLRTTAGDSEWSDRVHTIKQAWVWSNARAWLRQVSDAVAYEERIREFHRLQRRIEKTTEELVSIRAWRAFFDRLDQRTVQSLSAWTKAVGRIGRGTGKFAYRHRRTARQYLMDCVPCIPAWVMPLHRLWDMVDAKPGLFDTVIVDEASQASVDALALLLLAKRIIVVGDDKQNSPEAVGVLEDSIARLAREHLSQFRFRDEFRPDTSLFDHAERSFPSPVTLREHFRCVPEIIRFSNDLCYRDAPLIPLRQAPPNRLRALESKFVAEGACEGKGARILNRGEAAAVVEEIEKIVNDEEYRGKSIGVIALQGNAQAHLIEHELAKRLDPETMEERRLRCGGPAAFQGDERDVIVLSLVTAPNVRHRALTTLSDQRRFNVAMSRARDQVRLFHSVRQHDLGPDDLRRRLIAFFENPVHDTLRRQSEDLNRLEREARSRRLKGNQPEPYESWFEFDVALELLRLGFAVRPQVEVAGYRIDLVVEGSDARLAVECDGDAWHGAERYEHDMMRQRQLERAHWTFVRIRESAWYANRGAAVKTVVDACKGLGIRPFSAMVDAPSPPAKATSMNISAASENHRHAGQEALGEPMLAGEGEEAATPAEPVPELSPRSTPHEASSTKSSGVERRTVHLRDLEDVVSHTEHSPQALSSLLAATSKSVTYWALRGYRSVGQIIAQIRTAEGEGRWRLMRPHFPDVYENVREAFEDESWIGEMTPEDAVEATMEAPENTNAHPETAPTREESVHAETKRARRSSVVEESRAVDLSDLGDLAIEIGYHVERGIRRVPDVIRVAKEAFGDEWDELKAFFPRQYEKVREVFEDEPWVAEMTPTDEVDAAMEAAEAATETAPDIRPTEPTVHEGSPARISGRGSRTKWGVGISVSANAQPGDFARITTRGGDIWFSRLLHRVRISEQPDGSQMDVFERSETRYATAEEITDAIRATTEIESEVRTAVDPDNAADTTLAWDASTQFELLWNGRYEASKPRLIQRLKAVMRISDEGELAQAQRTIAAIRNLPNVGAYGGNVRIENRTARRPGDSDFIYSLFVGDQGFELSCHERVKMEGGQWDYADTVTLVKCNPVDWETDEESVDEEALANMRAVAEMMAGEPFNDEEWQMQVEAAREMEEINLPNGIDDWLAMLPVDDEGRCPETVSIEWEE